MRIHFSTSDHVVGPFKDVKYGIELIMVYII